MDEAAKRHELQLVFLREGFTQEEARKSAEYGNADRVDKMLELLREHAMQFPERQIRPSRHHRSEAT